MHIAFIVVLDTHPDVKINLGYPLFLEKRIDLAFESEGRVKCLFDEATLKRILEADKALDSQVQTPTATVAETQRKKDEDDDDRRRKSEAEARAFLDGALM